MPLSVKELVAVRLQVGLLGRVQLRMEWEVRRLWVWQGRRRRRRRWQAGRGGSNRSSTWGQAQGWREALGATRSPGRRPPRSSRRWVTGWGRGRDWCTGRVRSKRMARQPELAECLAALRRRLWRLLRPGLELGWAAARPSVLLLMGLAKRHMANRRGLVMAQGCRVLRATSM